MSKKILILATNPRNDLRIDREIRDLKKAIARSKNSDNFEIEIEPAVLPEDLQELLYDNQPYIVHFCGHGTGEDGLVFENEDGEEQLVSNQALANLFRILGKDIECVLLNACHTETQVDLFVEHIPFAIGTSKEILDKAAYWFAVGFYKALVREQSIANCYEWGCNAIQLNLPNVNLVTESTGQFRKLVAIAEDDSEVESEPLKIVLKQKSALEFVPQTFALKSATPIPLDIEAELRLEQEIKEYQDLTRTAINNLGRNPDNLVSRKPISQTEYRQRQTLLSKVKEFWIKGFLKSSLYADSAINLELRSRPEAILRPKLSSEVLPIELDESFAELQQTDIYQQIGKGKTLLILGEPGSGKTITLLQLAEHLIDQTAQDLTKPIPIVFNLSSWGQKQQPLEQWLIKEFQTQYQVPRLWSEQWLKEEQLILLLDGLDEVLCDRRNACVLAINQFITTHNLTEIIVCSRVKDYEALSEKLQLSSAICIKPLSSEQVYSFLDSVGVSLSGLKNLLQQDQNLEQFAQTPLILNVMSLAYQGWSTADLLQELKSTDNPYSHLFDSYIQRMLNRKVSRTTEPNYPKEKVIHWLSWLAKQMVIESKTTFLIEKLHFSLLNSQEIKNYKIISGLIFAIIFGLIGGLAIILIPIVMEVGNFEFIFGLFGSLIGGLIGGIFFTLFIEPSFFVVAGLMLLIIGVIYFWLIVNLSFFSIFGIILGVCGGIFGAYTNTKEIELYEKISWSWRWQSNKSRKIPWFSFGLILLLIFVRILKVNYGLNFIILLISFGLIMILDAGLNSQEVDRTILSNQGVWNSAKNAVTFSMVSGLIGGLLIDLIYGFMLAIVFGMEKGGGGCIQHFVLRIILYHKSFIPWNYARFLDYASKRLLMKKVGGGYVFYHRMLMEHFVKMATEKPIK